MVRKKTDVDESFSIKDKACSVCKAEFREEALDEHGRCFRCAESGLMPGAITEQEYVQRTAQRREDLIDLISEVVETKINEWRGEKKD